MQIKQVDREQNISDFVLKFCVNHTLKVEILFQEQKLRVLSDNFSECNDKTFLQHLAKVDTFGIYKLIFHTFWQQAVAVLVARSENLCFPLLI